MNKTELIAQREQVNKPMKRCQTGVGGRDREALYEASIAMAKCCVVLGKLISQVEAADALEAAQPVGEPVAWGGRSFDGVVRDCIGPDTHAAHPGEYKIPLYTHPAAPQVPMTEAEIGDAYYALTRQRITSGPTSGVYALARAIEDHFGIGVKS